MRFPFLYAVADRAYLHGVLISVLTHILIQVLIIQTVSVKSKNGKFGATSAGQVVPPSKLI